MGGCVCEREHQLPVLIVCVLSPAADRIVSLMLRSGRLREPKEYHPTWAGTVRGKHRGLWGLPTGSHLAVYTLYCMPQGINRRSYHEKAVEYMSKFPAPADDDTMRRFFGAEVRCVPISSATCAWTLIGSMVACTGAAWSAVFLHHGQLLPRLWSSWRVNGGSPFAAAASRLHVRLPAAAARL